MFLTRLTSPYRSVMAAFSTSLPLELAVVRLRGATKPSLLGTQKEAAVGTVTRQRVFLQRLVPGTGNSFKPIFVGRFDVVEGETQLRGVFTIHWVVKLFMLFWYGGCIYWTVLATRSALEEPGTMTLVPLLGIFMILLGASVVLFFSWLADDDRCYLEEVITRALSESASSGAMRFNLSAHTDTQQQDAASRQSLRAGGLQR